MTQVGLRSAEREEHDYIREQGLRFSRPREFRAAGPTAIAEMLSENVYITFDLDGFDSSEMSARRHAGARRPALGRGQRAAGGGRAHSAASSAST